MTRQPSEAEIEALPYRPCVGLMILGPANLVFAGQRRDSSSDAWQMPQGGIDKGETPLEAALREMGEETGLAPEQVRLLRESRDWLDYDLPRGLVPKLWKGRYRGQTQRWFAFRFPGPDDAVNIATKDAEFTRWCWMEPDALIERIVPFKRDVYTNVFREFADLLAR